MMLVVLLKFSVFAAWLAAASANLQYCGPRQRVVPSSTWEGVAEQRAGPSDPSQFSAWLANMTAFRTTTLASFNYSGANYGLPRLAWIQKNFLQPQMMIHDRYFFDYTTGKYTIDRYMNDTRVRYGGVDSVLVWHSYPNIGVDSRNQFDLLQDLPGGIAGISSFIEEFHANNVSVLFPYNPWDQGTRDSGQPDYTTLNDLWAEVGADGFNGDTCGGVSQPFFDPSRPLGLEPEGGIDTYPELEWNTLSWGYWGYGAQVPTVCTYKWLEQRHRVNLCDRWSQDKTDQIQFAFFNGHGVETWENVWGIWNQITDRDGEGLRRTSAILRFFQPLLSSTGWVPHTPVLQSGVYASLFPDTNSKQPVPDALYLLINRIAANATGAQLTVPYSSDAVYVDVYHGAVLTPTGTNDDQATLSFDIEADGYGAVFVTSSLNSSLSDFLVTMRQMTQRPLESYSQQITVLPQTIYPINSTTPVSNAPDGMVHVPGGAYQFIVAGNEIEGGNTPGVDVQYPWESLPNRYHNSTVKITPFFMDVYPVTNVAFLKFLQASHYTPADTHNFLREWQNGTYPAGSDMKPVVWVSIDDARAYCAWGQKRLPHEWEWQYAAQGGESGRLYPWGNQWDASRVPVPDQSRSMRAADDVGSHPTGASPFGVQDLVGNVYQWTDEFWDEHTRAAVIRGGNYYQPQGSQWYLPQSYALNVHTKYLLMAPSIDRSKGIGFRCVVDATS